MKFPGESTLDQSGACRQHGTNTSKSQGPERPRTPNRKVSSESQRSSIARSLVEVLSSGLTLKNHLNPSHETLNENCCWRQIVPRISDYVGSFFAERGSRHLASASIGVNVPWCGNTRSGCRAEVGCRVCLIDFSTCTCHPCAKILGIVPT